MLEDKECTSWDSQRIGGYRSVLGVPLLREGVPIGVIGLTRSKPRAFSEQHIELLQTFADQAAIAIENVRLFDEIQDKSRQLEVDSMGVGAGHRRLSGADSLLDVCNPYRGPIPEIFERKIAQHSPAKNHWIVTELY